VTLRVAPLPAGFKPQDGTSRPGVQNAGYTLFTDALAPQVTTLFQFRCNASGEKIKFSQATIDMFTGEFALPAGVNRTLQQPVVFTTDFPSPGGLVVKFDCTAEGTTASGVSVKATASVTAPLSDASPIIIPCVQDSKTLCLQNGALELKVTFTDPSGRKFDGLVAPQETAAGRGAFYISNQRQIEIFVSAEGCGPTDSGLFWFFRAEPLTPFELELLVRNVPYGYYSFYGNQVVRDQSMFMCPQPPK